MVWSSFRLKHLQASCPCQRFSQTYLLHHHFKAKQGRPVGSLSPKTKILIFRSRHVAQEQRALEHRKSLRSLSFDLLFVNHTLNLDSDLPQRPLTGIAITGCLLVTLNSFAPSSNVQALVRTRWLGRRLARSPLLSKLSAVARSPRYQCPPSRR